MTTGCPNCGFADTEAHSLPDLGAIRVCGRCGTFFEPETRADPSRQLCDDCAFRPGSTERSDPWKWAEIVDATIIDPEVNRAFYCHKGLACRLSDDKAGYSYLIPPDGPAAMTPCAGWRATKAAYDAGALDALALMRMSADPEDAG